MVVLSSFFLFSYPLLAYAGTATPSNAPRVDADTDWDMDMDDIWVISPLDTAYTDVDLLIDDRTLVDIDDFGDLKRDGLLRCILCEFVAIHGSSDDPSFASSSDAALSPLEDAQDVSDLEEGPTDIIPMDAPVRSARSVSASDDYVNVPRYDISISGQEYTPLFPPEYMDSLYVDSQDRLLSVLANTIQDHLVDGNFNPCTRTSKPAYLTSCPGNNFYTVSECGSSNYIREYYRNSGSLRYRDTYVNI